MFVKTSNLDPGAAKIVQAYRASILKRLAKPEEAGPAEEGGLSTDNQDCEPKKKVFRTTTLQATFMISLN